MALAQWGQLLIVASINLSWLAEGSFIVAAGEVFLYFYTIIHMLISPHVFSSSFPPYQITSLV